MIFKAFVLPTPKRIRRYFEHAIDEMNSETIKHSDFIFEKDINNIEKKENLIKNIGFSIKIF